MSLCWMKGVEDPDPAWFNPYQKKLFSDDAKDFIPEAAAITFLDLAATGAVPSWVAVYVDISLIRAAAKS